MKVGYSKYRKDNAMCFKKKLKYEEARKLIYRNFCDGFKKRKERRVCYCKQCCAFHVTSKPFDVERGE